MRRFPAMAIALLSLISVDATVAQSQPASIGAGSNASRDMAFTRFNQAIERYVMLKRRVEHEVPPRRTTRNVAEIQNRTNALFLALQRARPKAKQGDFFDAASSQAIKERFKNALTGVNSEQFQAAIRDDPADNRLPRVHMRYPVTGSMATMPADLLEILPELPAELEYRLVGRYLVLRDVDAALILDYLAQAVPSNGYRAAGTEPAHIP